MVGTGAVVRPLGPPTALTTSLALVVAMLVGSPVAADDWPHACPADAVPRSWFVDVGGAHEFNIDCVVWHGVARGVSALTYGSSDPVRRGQMASFLARLVERVGIELPEPSDQGFVDIDSNVHAGAINQLAEIGIVQGTSATTYEPDVAVRRGQMATFLVRTVELVGEHTLDIGQAPFTDTAGTAHELSIGKAYTAGLARGTSATTYSPSGQVRRDQMASFLARTLEHLSVVPPGVEPGPRFTIGPGVVARDEQTASNGIEQAITLTERLTDYKTRDFDVFVFADGEGLGEALCDYLDEPDDSPVCEHFRAAARNQIGGGDVGFIFTRTDGWPEIFGGGTAVITHEYVQALIDQLIGDVPRDPSRGDEVPLIGPRWLLEGVPTYMRFHIQFPDELGQLVDGAWTSVANSPERPSLPVTPRDLDEADYYDIDMMLVAVDVLNRDFGATPSDHMRFYELIGEGMSWEESFAETFSIDVEDFYDHFDDLTSRD